MIDPEKKDNTISEVIDVNGSKVFIENGKDKTILSEDVKRNCGYTSVEDAYKSGEAIIRMEYKLP